MTHWLKNSSPKVEAAPVVDDAASEAGGDDTGDDDDGDKDQPIEKLDDENQDLIEDASDLGEDDDDIGEVIEHYDDDTEDRG